MMPDLLRDPLALRQDYFARNLQMVGALNHDGVPFMAGTDAAPGVYIMPGFSLHDELANFVEAGFTPMERCRRRRAIQRSFSGWRPALVPSNPARSLTWYCWTQTHSTISRTHRKSAPLSPMAGSLIVRHSIRSL
jgi:hypothetical protein